MVRTLQLNMDCSIDRYSNSPRIHENIFPNNVNFVVFFGSLGESLPLILISLELLQAVK